MSERIREALAHATAAKSGAAAALRNAELAENLLLEELAETLGPVPPVERIAHGPGRLREATTTFGPVLGPVPKTWLSANLDRREPAKAPSVAANVCKEARDQGRENVVLTVPLAWFGGTQKGDPLASLAALRHVGSGLWDGAYQAVAEALAGFPNAVVRLGHEHNMAWAPWYSGDGRAGDYVAAWCRAQDVMRRAAPGLVYDWNVGASGADPDGDTGATWDPASWPGDDRVDVVGRDIYCRSNGRKPDVAKRALDEHAQFASDHGKPVSYPELGVTLGHNPAATDTVAGGFLELALGFADQADLAYLTFWASARTDQGYRYRPTPADKRTWAALAAAYS